MLRLKDSHGVIQKGGRGPVNEFGQDSEKGTRFYYYFFKQKNARKRGLPATETGPELPKDWAKHYHQILWLMNGKTCAVDVIFLLKNLPAWLAQGCSWS